METSDEYAHDYVYGDCLKDQSSKLKNIINNAEYAYAI